MGYKEGLCYQLQLVDVFNQNAIPKTADKTPGHKKVLQILLIGSWSNLDLIPTSMFSDWSLKP
jgi:hypothetical protein